MPITVDLSGLEVLLGLFDFLLVEVLVEAEEFGLFDGLGAADEF